MNAVHLHYLANERIAEYRRQADHARLFAPAAAPSARDIEPRVPRRGPLRVVGGVRTILRSVFA